MSSCAWPQACPVFVLQARTELHELLSKPSLVGIPLLVLGNKNDLPTALSTNELIDRLELKVTPLQDRS